MKGPNSQGVLKACFDPDMAPSMQEITLRFSEFPDGGKSPRFRDEEPSPLNRWESLIRTARKSVTDALKWMPRDLNTKREMDQVVATWAEGLTTLQAQRSAFSLEQFPDDTCRSWMGRHINFPCLFKEEWYPGGTPFLKESCNALSLLLPPSLILSD